MDLYQSLDKGILRDGFQQIVFHSDADGLFSIIKIIISTEDHDLDIRKFFFYKFT